MCLSDQNVNDLISSPLAIGSSFVPRTFHLEPDNNFFLSKKPLSHDSKEQIKCSDIKKKNQSSMAVAGL